MDYRDIKSSQGEDNFSMSFATKGDEDVIN